LAKWANDGGVLVALCCRMDAKEKMKGSRWGEISFGAVFCGFLLDRKIRDDRVHGSGWLKAPFSKERRRMMRMQDIRAKWGRLRFGRH
jgi:hypothetical protein